MKKPGLKRQVNEPEEEERSFVQVLTSQDERELDEVEGWWKVGDESDCGVS